MQVIPFGLRPACAHRRIFQLCLPLERAAPKLPPGKSDDLEPEARSPKLALALRRWATPCSLGPSQPRGRARRPGCWVEGPPCWRGTVRSLSFLLLVILWSVAACARPQQTRGPSESLYCLSAQIFRDVAATGHGVWGQVTHLVPPCNASWSLLAS